ncbi:hypothetical protein A2U01_0038117, partial [Trifolium medium]|nr:hypothetical protein [Trifolium medium]
IVLFKVLISNLIPRSGGTDTISWEHQYLMYFLQKEKKINLVDLLFGYLCQATKLVQIFRKVYPELLEEERAKKVDAGFLTKKHLKKQVVKPKNPLQTKYEEHFFYDGFPVISEADDEEVIQNFLEDFTKSTGIVVSRSMVPPAPNMDLYKPKKRKRIEKTSGEQGPKKKEMKKEGVTTSEKQKDDTVGKEKVVAEEGKKKDK